MPASAASPPQGIRALTPKQLLELTLLASIWGASFMFTRISVLEFGAVPLTALRSAIAALALLPVLLLSGQWPALRRHWPHILVIGLISTALPFTFITLTTQFTSAGFAAILNSLTPIFSALVAWLWLHESLNLAAVIGIVLSFLGVLAMVGDTRTIEADFLLLPFLTGLAATVLYGLTGNYSRRYLRGISAIPISAGCQFFAAIALAPAALLLWPEQAISRAAWGSAVMLGVLCTAFAFILYFHLLAQVGVARTVIVTYLVPVFAMFWGFLVLNETITLEMLLGTLCILSGIGLTTGLVGRRRRVPVSVESQP